MGICSCYSHCIYTEGAATQYQHIQSQHLKPNNSQTIGLILINPLPFSRFVFSLIKVCREIVCIYNRLRVNNSKSRQNIETKFVVTKCVGTKQLRLILGNCALKFTVSVSILGLRRLVKHQNNSVCMVSLYEYEKE